MTAAMVEIAPIDPAHPHARHCLQEYFSELDRRFDTGFDPARSIPADEDELRPPAGLFLVATLGADPIGCGALKFHDHEPTEIKRMWVAESTRGLGIGRRLLSELEDHAWKLLPLYEFDPASGRWHHRNGPPDALARGRGRPARDL